MHKTPRIRAQLQSLIDEMQVGEGLPGERRLAAALEVSRPTLRGVIDEFVREGRLVRKHGSGTYVAALKVELGLTATSFTRDMAQRGMTPSTRVLSFATRSAGPKLSTRLRVSPADEVVVVDRLRLADGEPMAVETLHVPRAIVPDLAVEDLGASFYGLLERRYGVTIAASKQTIEATVVTPDEAELLHVAPHSPALLFERVSRAKDGTVIELVRSVYRGDRYQLVTELTARSTDNPDADQLVEAGA